LESPPFRWFPHSNLIFIGDFPGHVWLDPAARYPVRQSRAIKKIDTTDLSPREVAHEVRELPTMPRLWATMALRSTEETPNFPTQKATV
jgi:hypothetical protein